MTEPPPPFLIALRAVASHASRDLTLPILASVLVRKGRLIATDRYTAARAPFAPIGHLTPELETDVILPLALVRELLKARRDPLTDIVLDGDRILVGFKSGITFGYPLPPANGLDGKDVYPNIDMLFDRYEPAEFDPATGQTNAPNVIAVSRSHLSKWSANVIGGAPMGTIRFYPASNYTKPMKVEVPEFPWLEALLVTVRMPDIESQRPPTAGASND